MHNRDRPFQNIWIKILFYYYDKSLMLIEVGIHKIMKSTSPYHVLINSVWALMRYDIIKMRDI